MKDTSISRSKEHQKGIDIGERNLVKDSEARTRFIEKPVFKDCVAEWGGYNSAL